MKMSTALIEHVRDEVKAGKEITREDLVGAVKERLVDILTADVAAIDIDRIRRESGGEGPVIIMVVGVNGAGKTTSAAKLAGIFKNQGKKVFLAAADTFRAAAVEQLRTWSERLDVSLVSGAPDAKPATVAYDAVVRAKEEDADVLIIDTAGRLHTKSNLMQELSGIKNIISRHVESAPHETILVVDGSTGQNALNQAREFNAAIPLTGVIVTKLDGTSKGGIIAAIKDELDISIRYIGVGESVDDLREFDAEEFVEALFDTSDENEDSFTLGGSQKSSHGDARRRRRDQSSGSTTKDHVRD